MIGHAILFIVLPLAVAWLAGASAYFPPYPAPKTDPVIEPAFEAKVRMFLAGHREPDAAADMAHGAGRARERADGRSGISRAAGGE